MTSEVSGELLGYQCHGFLCEEFIEPDQIRIVNGEKCCPFCGSPFVYEVWDTVDPSA